MNATNLTLEITQVIIIIAFAAGWIKLWYSQKEKMALQDREINYLKSECAVVKKDFDLLESEVRKNKDDINIKFEEVNKNITELSIKIESNFGQIIMHIDKITK